jgi:hypothetical protein
MINGVIPDTGIEFLVTYAVIQEDTTVVGSYLLNFMQQVIVYTLLTTHHTNTVLILSSENGLQGHLPSLVHIKHALHTKMGKDTKRGVSCLAIKYSTEIALNSFTGDFDSQTLICEERLG